MRKSDEQAPLLIISGPSGAGKTTVARRLIEQYPQIKFIATTTSRSPRNGEVDGKDYTFVSAEQFEQMREKNAFIESVKYNGNYYGTPASLIDDLDAGIPCVVVPDIRGAEEIVKRVSNTVTVWLTASEHDLRERLEQRGTETPQSIKRRLEIAELEIEIVTQTRVFKTIITNRDLEETVYIISRLMERSGLATD